MASVEPPSNEEAVGCARWYVSVFAIGSSLSCGAILLWSQQGKDDQLQRLDSSVQLIVSSVVALAAIVVLAAIRARPDLLRQAFLYFVALLFACTLLAAVLIAVRGSTQKILGLITSCLIWFPPAIRILSALDARKGKGRHGKRR
ncbi:MAG: hypothetical protein U0R49_07095 [Fimbriimonadales bacterium]